MNTVTLIGNLGKDPEMKSLPSGQPVTEFSLATSRKWKTKDGEKREETTWHNVKAWGRQAEVMAQYLARGNKVAITGRIDNRSWDKDDGTKGYRSEIVVENFEFLTNKADSGNGGGGYESRPSMPSPQGGADDDSDIPF